MATVHITYWRDIPVLVTARDAAGEATVPLDPGFQDLVDRVALQEGLTASEAYLAAWRVGPGEARPGPAGAAAAALGAELDARLDLYRARWLPLGRRPEASPG